MAWMDEFPGVAAMGERAEAAWRVPVGVASPLWAAFGAAASAGVAYWWLTQWTRAVNVEAIAGLVAGAPAPTSRRIEIVAETVAPATVEAPPAPVEVAPEPVAAAPAPMKEAELDVAPDAKAAPKAGEAASPPATQPDDLTRMVGIGPKLADALAASGVTRFAEIAAWTESDLTKVDAALSLKGRAVREAWVAQARRLADES